MRKKWGYPKARAVTAQEMNAEEDALARVLPCQALRCISPANNEHAPIIPPINAKVSKKVVDGFPPKWGWSCSPSMYLSRDHPASPSRIRYTTKFTAKRGPIRLFPTLPEAITKAQPQAQTFRTISLCHSAFVKRQRILACSLIHDSTIYVVACGGPNP